MAVAINANALFGEFTKHTIKPIVVNEIISNCNMYIFIDADILFFGNSL